MPQLEEELTGTDAEIKSLEEQLDGATDEETKAIIQDKLNDANARKGIVEKSLEGQTVKKEADERNKEDKKSAEKFEETEKERATADELQEKIDEDKVVYADLRKKIKARQDVLNDDGATEAETKKAGEELPDLQKKAGEVGNRLKANESAKKDAEKRAREAEGLGQSASEATVKIMSWEKFAELDSAAQTKYLIEIADAVNGPNSDELKIIKDKLKSGQKLSLKEAGQLILYASDSLFEKGKSKESLQLLHQAIKSRPEIGQAILDRLTQREDVKKAVDEMYPGMGKKIWDFARKYPGWLIFLLAALAAGTAVVTVGAGPILGVGAGAAGMGGGAFGLNKKDRW